MASRDLFFSEAEEMLTLMNNTLVALEKDPEDKKHINEIFRSAHTIKGMAGCEGLTAIQELAHAIEDSLNKLREGEIGVSRELMDTLFSSTDKLEALITAAKNNVPTEDVSSVVDKVKKETPQTPAAALTGAERRTHLRLEDADRTAIEAGQKEGLIAYELVITMKKDSVMMQARASVIVKSLQGKGHIINTERINKGILSGKYGRHFGMFFMTKNPPEAIRSGIESISDVEHVKMSVLPVDEILMGEEKVPKKEQKLEPLKEEIAMPEAREIQSIRVGVNKLDRLMNLVGELVISKIRLNNVLGETESPDIKEVVSRIDRLTQDLQDVATSTRLVPLSTIFNRFQRMVRDSAMEAKKEVSFEISGAEIELDRTILEGITDPLVHLLRNSVSHGIETSDVRKQKGKDPVGILSLSARREKNKVMIEVSDDGAGLDLERIRSVAKEKKLMPEDEINQLSEAQTYWLITRPGFSTKQETDGLSGRGVGMDVAKTVTESFGGRLNIESELGRGSTFTLELPLSMSIIKALLVSIRGHIFAIPLISIVETVRVQTDAIRELQDKEIFNLRGEVVPLIRLDRVLNLQGEEKTTLKREDRGQVVCIVEIGFTKVALAVDSMAGQQDVVVKLLPEYGGKMKGLSGVTILSDGQPCLILDVAGLA